MTSPSLGSNVSLMEIILSSDESIRHMSISDWCENHRNQMSVPDFALFLCAQAHTLDQFARGPKADNLYQKVRALFFLYSIHRYQMPDSLNSLSISTEASVTIPNNGYQNLLSRNFDMAIQDFLSVCAVHKAKGDTPIPIPNCAISSALAKAYYQLGFQTLADQVRISVREHPGNAWMFQWQDPSQPHPMRVHPELLDSKILCERTPVRMDLSHCGWSDIFFLGMDYPEGARVLNISIDLAVRGRHTSTSPPIETYLEITDSPTLQLTSIDLHSTATLTHVSQVFDFAADYLGLLKAAMIASGIVPPGLEAKAIESNMTLEQLFLPLLGPNRGLHLTAKVNDIPKGSRLAVSTNLLASTISVCMRATQQTASLTGPLQESERRDVAARAILGEWLGGSGGGWQDSGGLWPGIKLITGVQPTPSDPEYGLSRGRLLPQHRALTKEEAPHGMVQALHDSLVLVHGGMSQNVGPVLEMVTEKYLLRESKEWVLRQEALGILDDILQSFKDQDIRRLAHLTTRNFFGPIQGIIPWATNLYTETIIQRVRDRYEEKFFGFWMLGGCSGGGMGFIFAPEVKEEAQGGLLEIMLTTKHEMEHALPFAMDPIVYDFSINNDGTVGSIADAVPRLRCFSSSQASSTDTLGTDSGSQSSIPEKSALDKLLTSLGFDQETHEDFRRDYRSGKIGLRQNRLSMSTEILNAQPEDLTWWLSPQSSHANHIERGMSELRNGTVAVVSLAAGVGSRWTHGAGCVKALHPFCKLDGKHRSFLEVHLAKNRRMSELSGTDIPHVFTTSHMTNGPVQDCMKQVDNFNFAGPLYFSEGHAIGLRMIPMVSDLQFMFQEQQQQKLDAQAQKVKESVAQALMGWASSCGEATDYRDNRPTQCLHPVGHYYEIPNLIQNGTLEKMLQHRPQLKYLMLHNIDTVGADVDPGLLGYFAASDSTLCFEVIPREIEDVGGGLARVNGKTRIVEGLALPHEEDQFHLTLYNSMTTWIDIDRLLSKFGLTKEGLSDAKAVSKALHNFSTRLPTYVALKDVLKRWGNAHEDVVPTAQFEKLWSDMSMLEDIECDFVVVPRVRGAQLKEQGQLDSWHRDGSSSHLESICKF